jgi:cell wall-associated NlpC family hydrolase
VLVLALAIAAVAARSARAETPPRRPASTSLGIRAARFARHLLGIRYTWGGRSPASGFDCSGLVAFVYGHFGIRLPHYTGAQFQVGRPVSRRGLRPGDLVFFAGVSHVGLYMGRGRVLHANHTGGDVRIDRLGESWFRATYAGARRVVPT